jgi:pilus assembly protein CpaE
MLDSESAAAGDTNVSVALIAPDEERRRQIAQTISGTQARIVRELSEYPAGHALSRLVQSDCDVIIVDLDSGIGPGVELIKAICGRNGLVTVMACSSGYEADVVVQSMRAGAREFLTQPMAAATVAEAFMRAAARRQTGAVERAGKVLVFQGAKGGVGSTTLAINFAVALTKENAGSVVLVDFHPQLGEIALGLGMEPRFFITDAIDNSPRLDADLLSTLLIKHESGLMVLGSSHVYGTHYYRQRDTEQLLRILREEFAFVIVDAGSCSGSMPEALFEVADTIYLITEVNLPALRNARRLISWFAGNEARNLEVVLNRFNSRQVEIDEESTTKALSRPVDWKIPNDYLAVRSAQNLGTPLVMADTPVARVVCQMAKKACGKGAAANSRDAAAAVKGDRWKFWTSKSIRPLSTARS